MQIQSILAENSVYDPHANQTGRLKQPNKCGPGQPPGPHCFRGMSCRPFPRTRHGGVHLSLALRRALVKRCHSADTICEANSADRSAALRWPAASPAVCGGLCEEAATPGQPVLRRNAFWRNPPGNSPSRIARNRRLCRNAQAGHAEHLAGCEHFAPRTSALQAKTSAALCRICGWPRFFVESAGKME